MGICDGPGGELEPRVSKANRKQGEESEIM